MIKTMLFTLCWLLLSQLGYGWDLDSKASIEALITAESDWNPRANGHGGRGLMQVGVPALIDYNKVHKKRYWYREMYDQKINRKVGEWYWKVRIPELLKAFRHQDNFKNRMIAWNAGISFVKSQRINRCTRGLIYRYKKALK